MLARHQEPLVLGVLHQEVAAGLTAVVGLAGHVLQAALLVQGAPDDFGEVPPVHAGQGVESQPGLLAAAFHQPEVGSGEGPDNEGQQESQNP